MTVDTENSSMEDTEATRSSDTSIQSLEQRYIDLLERRIAQLESQLDSDDEKPAKSGIRKGKKRADDVPVDGDVNVDKKRPRVRKVVSLWDHKTDNRRDYERVDTAPSAKAGSIIFRRIMDAKDDKTLLSEELEIESHSFKKFLGGVLRHYSPHQFQAKTVKFYMPFKSFVWQWDKLVESCNPVDGDSESTKEAREDMRDVLTLLEGSDALGSYFTSRTSDVAGGTISFDFIWTLFAPGTRIYAQSFMGELQMFEVVTVVNLYDPGPAIPKGVDIVATAFDWDGTAFRPYIYQFSIPRWEGPRSILSLPCFPVSVYNNFEDDGGSKLMDSLLARSHTFWRLCTEPIFQYEYTGSILVIDKDKADMYLGPRDKKPPPKRALLDCSKVIVDNFSFMRSRRNPDSGSLPLGKRVAADMNVTCPCDWCRETTARSWFRELENPLNELDEKNENFVQSNDRLLLCPPKVLGYSLQLKEWCQLAVEKVAPLSPAAVGSYGDYFDSRLEMEPRDKAMVKAMIQNHVSSPKHHMIKEAVEGKGRGLVILLHGPPGVGKTLTAETVALATGKPLVSVSTAEIGIQPEDAERSLKAIFDDASRWGAVLLIDEADVFLEERKGTRDLQRNALVAVLLRVLEYYQGIIILTTNRIMSLDVAVESRIHLAIQYKDLTTQQRIHIFSSFLDDIDDDKISDREAIKQHLAMPLKLMNLKLNGRQIRNIVMSALLLAESEQRKLSWTHVLNAIHATNNFLECLKDSSGKKREHNEAPLLEA